MTASPSHVPQPSSATPRHVGRLLLAATSVLTAVVLLFNSTASTAQDTRSSTQAGQATLLVLGDSISAEYGLQRDSGWVKLLESRLHAEHDDYRIVNASISGETTSGGLARIDELLGRIRPAIVIVELGGNDALRGLPLASTQKNLDQIVSRSKNAGARVLIIGIQIPPNYGKVYADQFAALFASTSQRYATALTPFFFAGFADRLDLFQPDRIHPTLAAQGLLLDNVWPALKPLVKRR